jgi:diguanylate cyclase (GGDEF)-like protein/PAS domain S-box-containing protein
MGDSFSQQNTAGRGLSEGIRTSHAQWVRILAFTVGFFLVCTLVGAVGIGYRLAEGFEAIRSGWTVYASAVEPRSQALYRLRAAFDADGELARFDDYVADPEPLRLVSIQRDFTTAQEALLTYEALELSATEAAAVTAIRTTVDHYADAIEAVAKAAAAGTPVPKDGVSSTQTAPTAAALDVLERERQRAGTRAAERLDEKVSLGLSVINRGALILPGLIAAGLLLIWLLRRLVKETATRTHAEDVLRRSEERYRDLYDNAPNAYFTVSLADRRILRSNVALARMLGWIPGVLDATSLFDNLPDTDDGNVRAGEIFSKLADGEKAQDVELRMKHRSGRLIWASLTAEPVIGADGRAAEARCTAVDISDRKRAEEEIQTVQEELMHRANFDQLTGLPNRTLLLDRLSQALIRAHRQHDKVAVMFIDLDRFKYINDTYGHEAGDLLLKDAAKRLRSCVREGDTVARLAGDEFVVVLSAIATVHDASVVAAKVVTRFTEPFPVGDAQETISASVGIALFPEDGTNMHALLRNADTAMYSAKQGGRNRFGFFRPQQATAGADAETIGGNIRQALDSGEMSLEYQPILDTKSTRIVGAEALLRWRSPVLGSVDPMQFIPVAEEKGTIVAIGEWVMDEACRTMSLWRRDPGYDDLRLSVNVSSRQVIGGHLHNSITRALAATNLDPGGLEIEIPESLLRECGADALSTLCKLGDMGVRLCIEDFGLGNGSLADMTRYPVKTLKIDKGLVRDIEVGNGKPTIAKAVIEMAHVLGLDVTAEGVETKEQLAYLMESGCDRVQGNLFSEPLSSAAFIAYLSSQSRLVSLRR